MVGGSFVVHLCEDIGKLSAVKYKRRWGCHSDSVVLTDNEVVKEARIRSLCKSLKFSV